jgi:tetratricopeptide (TPR) repeat protein
MANVYSKFMRTLTLLLLSLLVACTASKPVRVPERADQSQPLPGGDANSHLMIAEIALQRGDNLAAAREYLAAARLSSDAALATQATRIAFEARQPSIAMQSARRWLELDAANADAHRYLAITALRMHAIEESAREFDHLLHTTYPTPAQAFTDLTAVLVDEDNSYGAYLVMSKLAAKQPKVQEGQYALSVAALRTYNYEVAVSSARKALDLKRDYLDAERLLARALVVSGKSKEGLEIARARAKTANDAESRMEVVLLLVASDDETAARAELAPLLDMPDARVEALRTLATLEFSAGRLDDAIKYFNELVASGRYVSLAFYSLGSIYERRHDSPNAVKYYTRVISGPYAVDAQLRSARLLALADQRERANQLLDDFMVENPQLEIEMVLGRARLLADEGDAETALALTDAVRARYPDDPTIRYARSLTLERLDRSDEAIKDLRDLLAQRPDDPVALNALGYTMVEHQQDVKEAQAMIRKSLDMTPDNPAVQDSLGWALYRAGDERGALKWLERAYATEKDAEIAAHIGEVHWALGDRTRAREVWDKALADDPSHRYLLETLRRHPE